MKLLKLLAADGEKEDPFLSSLLRSSLKSPIITHDPEFDRIIDDNSSHRANQAVAKRGAYTFAMCKGDATPFKLPIINYDHELTLNA